MADQSVSVHILQTGLPQVVCNEDAVTFSVKSRNPFTGNIYIKGKFNDQSCRQEFFSNTFNGAQLTIKIPQCGMKRIKQPQGMNYILVFVVSFHSQFETKVDRAYNVRCFYSQQEKTVTSQLDVSMIATQNLDAGTMLIPNCEYSIRSDTLNGPRIRYINVGDRLFHRWECDNSNYGMLVKNCFVSDGVGLPVRVLDGRGCPVFSPVIQGSLKDNDSLNLAYVEVWAYKFPDRSDLLFQCQIQMCNKKENECVGITPPNCPLIPKSSFIASAGDGGILSPGVGPDGQGVTVVHGTFPEVGGRLVAGVSPLGPTIPRSYLGIRPAYPGPINPLVPKIYPRPSLSGFNPYLSDNAAAFLKQEQQRQRKQQQHQQEQLDAEFSDQDVISNRSSGRTSTPINSIRPPVLTNAKSHIFRTIPFPVLDEETSRKPIPISVDEKKFAKRQTSSAQDADKQKSTQNNGTNKKRVTRSRDFPELPQGNVLDVASEPIFVVDVTDSSEDIPKPAHQNGHETQAGRICIDASAFSMLLITLGILVSTLVFLLILVLCKTDQLKNLWVVSLHRFKIFSGFREKLSNRLPTRNGNFGGNTHSASYHR